MKAGDIIFVRGNSLLSRIIRFFDKGEFSHVAIAVSETEVLEAQYFTKSRITPFYFTDYEIVDLGLSDAERKKVDELGPVLVGRWYDYIQVISYLFKHPFNNPNHLICSELVAIILSEIDRAEYSEVINLTPNELYRYLRRK
jgi:hypothetical protein